MSLAQTVIEAVKTAINVSDDLMLNFSVSTSTSSLDTATNTVTKLTSENTFVGVYDDFEIGNVTGSTAVKDSTKVFLFKRDEDDLSQVTPNSEISDGLGKVFNVLKVKPIYAGSTAVAVELMRSE